MPTKVTYVAAIVRDGNYCDHTCPFLRQTSNENNCLLFKAKLYETGGRCGPCDDCVHVVWRMA